MGRGNNTADSSTPAAISNIGATTINATQWGYLGATDQALATTDSVQFNSAIVDSTSTEALLVRKDGDTGDVFTVDTTNSVVAVTGNITVSGTVDGIDIATQDSKLESLYTTIGLSALTSGEVDQLENIGATTISATQWGYLGATNQALATTDSVQFGVMGIYNNVTSTHSANENISDSDRMFTVRNQSTASTNTYSSISMRSSAYNSSIIMDQKLIALGSGTGKSVFTMVGTNYLGTTNFDLLELNHNKQVTIPVTTKISATVNPSSSTGGALNVGGDIVLGATTPRIHFPTNGYAAPTFTNRSAGTKIVLYPQLGASNGDYSIGIENAALWNCVPSVSQSFKWYVGVTEVMTLSGSGSLTTGSILPRTTEAHNLGSAALEWNNVYSQNSVTVSDRNKKKDISSETIGLDFVNELSPKTYKYISTDTSSRGLIAQDLEELCSKYSIEGLVSKVKEYKTIVSYDEEDEEKEILTEEETGDFHYGIVYNNLLSILIKAVQELDSKKMDK